MHSSCDLYLYSVCWVAWSTLSAFDVLGSSFVFQKKQREFEEYIRDKYITAKADFRTLLKETKFITYRCVAECHPGALFVRLHVSGKKLLFCSLE